MQSIKRAEGLVGAMKREQQPIMSGRVRSRIREIAVNKSARPSRIKVRIKASKTDLLAEKNPQVINNYLSKELEAGNILGAFQPLKRTSMGLVIPKKY